ncbi:uncharacterized protein AB675_1835 [Cyphellophora attinorum]|uniref:Uncharacterized protein n=1 Tax=Cyphellophora attinorum TaxID=1664694 RepID=A0A0N1HEB6_9EURO|nr:uncharacterized protein AB675_1835 [Phialophora attinorum]KPI43090.1 hypothetical protein AB675_1835 [Phialophora attinorum]
MASSLFSIYPGRGVLEKALYSDLVLRTSNGYEIKAHRIYVNVASKTVRELSDEALRTGYLPAASGNPLFGSAAAVANSSPRTSTPGKNSKFTSGTTASKAPSIFDSQPPLFSTATVFSTPASSAAFGTAATTSIPSPNPSTSTKHTKFTFGDASSKTSSIFDSQPSIFDSATVPNRRAKPDSPAVDHEVADDKIASCPPPYTPLPMFSFGKKADTAPAPPSQTSLPAFVFGNQADAAPTPPSQTPVPTFSFSEKADAALTSSQTQQPFFLFGNKADAASNSPSKTQQPTFFFGPKADAALTSPLAGAAVQTACYKGKEFIVRVKVPPTPQSTPPKVGPGPVPTVARPTAPVLATSSDSTIDCTCRSKGNLAATSMRDQVAIVSNSDGPVRNATNISSPNDASADASASDDETVYFSAPSRMHTQDNVSSIQSSSSFETSAIEGTRSTKATVEDAVEDGDGGQSKVIATC